MLATSPRNLGVVSDGTELVTIAAAAKMLGVTPKTVYEWVDWGWLEKRSAIDPIARKRRTVFDRAAVEKLAAERRAGILREVPRRRPKPPDEPTKPT